MKILVLAVRDTGGTGYTLCHAINNQTNHQAVNVRGMNNFINYPTICEMGNYNRSRIREMAYKADVILFLGAMAPFYKSLRLIRKKMRDTKKILLCMGSEWRYGREQLIEQADHYLRDYKIALGGADMFLPLDVTQPDGTVKHLEEAGDDVEYIPVVRSFDELFDRYGISKRDYEALQSFDVPEKKVSFVHAPTSEANKGSPLFYKVATRAMQRCPNMVFKTVWQQPWASTLSTIAGCGALYDQAPPFPTAYGALSIEAGVFSKPSFTQIDPRCRAFIKRRTGLDTPFIAFNDEEELYERTVMIASDPKIRRMFGELNYKYCRALHDEKPVVERFLKIVEKM